MQIEGVVNDGMVERKRWAEPEPLNFCCFRFRLQVGRWLFSAQLFSRIPPGRRRSNIPRLHTAALDVGRWLSTLF